MKTIIENPTGFKTVTEILKNNYPELLKAVEKDGYIIQYENFDAFCEITFDDEAIGFYTFEQVDTYSTVINEMFITKEYRGHEIPLEVFLGMFQIPNTVLYLRNPSKKMIDTLIKCGLAFPLTDRIVYCFLQIMGSSDDVFKNSKIKRFYRNKTDKIYIPATFYDSELKCAVTLAQDSEFAKAEGTPIIFEPRKEDIKRYRLRKKLKKVTQSFLEREIDEIISVIDDSLKCHDEAYDRMIELSSLENIELPSNLSRSDVEKNIERVSLHPRYTRVRLAYLEENPDKISCEPDMSLLPDRCPYCENEILPIYEDCPECGFHLISLDYDTAFIDSDGRLYREVTDKIKENGWDEDEIYRLQCLCGCYEYIRVTQEGIRLSLNEVDRSNKLKKGSVLSYGLENGYLKKLSHDEYLTLLESEYSKSELKSEAAHLGMEAKFTRKGIIRQIGESGRQSFEYIETEKGMDLYRNCEILSFYMDNLRTFLFCEFKKFTDEHDTSLEEAGDAFIEREFERGMENGDWSVYRQVLKYRLARSDNPDETLKLAVQILIYDLNSDECENPMGLDVEFDTMMYLMEALSQGGLDSEGIFESAYEEFEIAEMKHKKDEVHEILMEMENGDYFNRLAELFEK